MPYLSEAAVEDIDVGNRVFDPAMQEKYEILKKSIAKHGVVLIPLIVDFNKMTGKYALKDGFYRLFAAEYENCSYNI